MAFKRPPIRTILPPLLFAAVVLACNPQWFRVPMIENSDTAANSLQVFHARHFHELLGNYSRWQFHHPGPVFFYLFAAGEALFADLLRVVPATLNAQYLTLVLVNTALLFGAIEICAQHFTGAFFRPLALTAAVLVIYNLNTGTTPGALVSLWMPHVALFPFLFFSVACASVMAGRIGHLPLAALGAMMLVHLHVAQLLFAGVLGLMAGAAAVLWTWRARAFRKYRGAFALSAGIVALFLLPIVLELVLHHPNNLDDIRGYLQRYPDPSRGLAVASKYLLGFLLLSQDTTLLVLGPAGGLFEQALHSPHVVVYWVLLAAGLAAAAILAVRGVRSRFAGMLLAVGVVAALLFLYWGNRITGDMYSFNGYFFFSVHLLALFWVAGTLSGWQEARQPVWSRWARVLWALPFLCMLPAAAEFRNPDVGSQAVGQIARTLPPGRMLQLVFRHDDWDTAVGVANQLARHGRPFCIAAEWGFMFGREYVCPPGGAPRTVAIAPTAWYDLGSEPLPWPIDLEAGGVNARSEGLYPLEGDHAWTAAKAALRFTPLPNPAGTFRLTVTASVLPGRPVAVALNGHPLGTLEGIWKSSATLAVARGWVRFGEENELAFGTANAGPIAGDSRQVGFSLVSVRLEAAP